MLMQEVGTDWDDKGVLGNTYEKHDRMKELWTENRYCLGRLQTQKMDALEGADESDVYTMKGFFYMVRIVQDPVKNGPKHYLEVMRDFEKALKLNPDNSLAKQLQEKFNEGMSQR